MPWTCTASSGSTCTATGADMIEISISDEDFSRALRQLKSVPYGIQKAMYPAVAETMQHIREELIQYLASSVPLPKNELKKSVRRTSVTNSRDSVSGSISVLSSDGIPLIHYDVEEKTPTARPGMRPYQWPDFTFSLRKGERRTGRSIIKGIGLPFVAVMPKSDHMGVFFRAISNSNKNAGDVVLGQLFGPSVQYHVATPEAESMVERESEERLPVILARYVQQTLALEAAK